MTKEMLAELHEKNDQLIQLLISVLLYLEHEDLMKEPLISSLVARIKTVIGLPS